MIDALLAIAAGILTALTIVGAALGSLALICAGVIVLGLTLAGVIALALLAQLAPSLTLPQQKGVYARLRRALRGRGRKSREVAP